MTKVKTPSKDSFADFASQMARNPETLAAFTEAMADATRKREIGKRIADERERRGLTQPQVAERAGIGSSASALRKYQNWEAGKHLPGHEQMEQIADVLHVSYDYLVTGGEQAPPVKDILRRLDKIEQRLGELAAISGATAPAATGGLDLERVDRGLDQIERQRDEDEDEGGSQTADG